MKILMTVLREAPFSIKLRARYHGPRRRRFYSTGCYWATRWITITPPEGHRSPAPLAHDPAAGWVTTRAPLKYCGHADALTADERICTDGALWCTLDGAFCAEIGHGVRVATEMQRQPAYAVPSSSHASCADSRTWTRLGPAADARFSRDHFTRPRRFTRPSRSLAVMRAARLSRTTSC